MSQIERPSGGSIFGTVGFILLAGFIAVGTGFFWLRGERSGATPAHATGPGAAAPSRGELAVGAIVRLQPNYNHPVWVVVNADSWRDLWRAHQSRDPRAIDAVFQAGRAFVADDDTEAQVLGSGVEFYRIRLLEGAHQGRTGWVPAYNVAATALQRDW